MERKNGRASTPSTPPFSAERKTRVKALQQISVAVAAEQLEALIVHHIGAVVAAVGITGEEGVQNIHVQCQAVIDNLRHPVGIP